MTWVGPALQGETWSDAPQSATLTSGGVEARVHGAGLDDAESVVPLLLERRGPGVQWDERQRCSTRPSRGCGSSATPPLRRCASARRSRGRSSWTTRWRFRWRARRRASSGRRSGPARSLRARRCGSRAPAPRSCASTPTVGPIPTGRVPIRLRYGAPGARHAKTKTVVVHLRRSERLPRAEGLVARREGDDVVVTWRTDSRSRRLTRSPCGPPRSGTRSALGACRGRDARATLQRAPA